MPFFSFLSPPSFLLYFLPSLVSMSEFLFTKNVVLSNAADLKPVFVPRASPEPAALSMWKTESRSCRHTHNIREFTNTLKFQLVLRLEPVSLAPESVALFCPHVRRIKHFVCFLRTRLKACMYRWCRLKTNKQTKNKNKKAHFFDHLARHQFCFPATVHVQLHGLCFCGIKWKSRPMANCVT